MNSELDKRLKARGKLFKSLPVSDWKHIVAFEKIIRNYLKMRELLKSNKND